MALATDNCKLFADGMAFFCNKARYAERSAARFDMGSVVSPFIKADLKSSSLIKSSRAASRSQLNQ